MPERRRIYINSAPRPLSNDELLQLLQTSRHNNAGRGVTGMLLYGNGAFLAVLIAIEIFNQKTVWGGGMRRAPRRVTTRGGDTD